MFSNYLSEVLIVVVYLLTINCEKQFRRFPLLVEVLNRSLTTKKARDCYVGKTYEFGKVRTCVSCIIYWQPISGQIIKNKEWVGGLCGWHARHEPVPRFMWSLVTGSVAGGAVFYRSRIKQPIQSLDALV